METQQQQDPKESKTKRSVGHFRTEAAAKGVFEDGRKPLWFFFLRFNRKISNDISCFRFVDNLEIKLWDSQKVLAWPFVLLFFCIYFYLTIFSFFFYSFCTFCSFFFIFYFFIFYFFIFLFFLSKYL